MNSSELRRYDRQLILADLGLEGQQKLKSSNVLIVGAGGLGSPALLYLAAAGVGRIGVIDYDVVEESNLQRQVLFNNHDLGKNKAEAAVEKLMLLNPYLVFDTYPFKLEPENAFKIFSNYTLMLDCSDNFSTRYLVNDTCVELKKPFVFGSILRFEGQVSVFNLQGGPNYRMLYPEAPSDELALNCSEAGVIGTLPGIVGTYMANESIKILAGFGETLSGKLLTIDVLHNQTQIFSFATSDIKNTKQYDSSIPLINQSILSEWKENGEDFMLIDVREAYEYDEHNIGGTNIPVHELPERISEILAYKKVVFACTTGTRSKLATAILAEHHKEILVFNINV
ncbi:HesA/MoeB/ThiF family protein [Pedobacter insulae]|uniref:Molybdopterin-synthase adenylyltransferase n=1 Tax=Pedobacter insulae TaxID=414048 RepID=A0A1I3A197_9SPHI|nr:HesA/MoeB/ThiF family protein [Pedobacter insulae]SFH43656.1 adenylyltransferase and sulfurtransferase [Pedobacter insulae]